MATVYVWQKYTTVTKYSEPDWGTPSSGYSNSPSAPSGYTSYTFDTTNGYVAGSTTGTASTTGSNVYEISADGKSITRYNTTSTGWAATGASSGYTTYTGSTYTKGVTETESYGSSLGVVKSANQSEYPSFGKHTDGYWYIYITTETIPEIKGYVNIGGVAKEIKDIYVNVGGVAKKASGLFCNIGGTAKKYRQPNFTNQLPISTDTDGSIFNGKGYMENQRLTSSTGVIEGCNGSYVTGFIPYKYGDTAYLKNVTFQKGITTGITSSLQRICFYDANKTFLGLTTAQALTGMCDGTFDANNIATSFITSSSTGITGIQNVAYFRLNGTYIGDDSIITVNEEITYAN